MKNDMFAKSLATPTLDQILALPHVRYSLAYPQIDTTHDVPYLAGASNSGPVTHIDRRLPQFDPKVLAGNGQPLDLHRALNVHEQVERATMEMGVPYEKAHAHYATPAERSFVENAGASWNEYEHAMDGYLNETEHENPANPPPSLYLKPYPHKEEEFLKREAANGPAPTNPMVHHILMGGKNE
jgi:hypothetical protein